jgi:hypothetical protein
MNMTEYIVKTTYPEENEVTLALFHYRMNAKEFIIEAVIESEAYDGTVDEGDIESMLDETNTFVDEVSGVEYEIVPTSFKDEI